MLRVDERELDDLRRRLDHNRLRGVDVAAVAAAVDDVMGRRGYHRYVAQGGDWGALVTRELGEHHSDRVAVAGWILEKFHIWCDIRDGMPISTDRLIDVRDPADAWAAARYNLVHHSVADRGGHFAAFEQPALFAADLAAFADVLLAQRVF